MLISELLEKTGQQDTITMEKGMSLMTAAEILCDYNIGAVPIVDDEDNILGILSERDIVRSMVSDKEQAFDKLVDDVMTSSVITCSMDDKVSDVFETLKEKKIRHIPIVIDGKLEALISIRDFAGVL